MVYVETGLLLDEFKEKLISGNISDEELVKLMTHSYFNDLNEEFPNNKRFIEFVSTMGKLLDPNILHELTGRMLNVSKATDDRFLINISLERTFLAFELAAYPDEANKHFLTGRMSTLFKDETSAFKTDRTKTPDELKEILGKMIREFKSELEVKPEPKLEVKEDQTVEKQYTYNEYVNLEDEKPKDQDVEKDVTSYNDYVNQEDEKPKGQDVEEYGTSYDSYKDAKDEPRPEPQLDAYEQALQRLDKDLKKLEPYPELQAKVLELKDSVIDLKGEVSEPELISVLDNTHKFLNRDPDMDLKKYQDEAKKLQGKRSPAFMALGNLMFTIGAIAVTVGIAMAATGVGLVPGAITAVVGAGIAAAGAAFFAKGAKRSGGNTADVAKQMKDVAEDVEKFSGAANPTSWKK